MLKQFATLTVLALALTACSESITTGPNPTSGPRSVLATDTDRDGGLHFVGLPDLTASRSNAGVFLTATGEVAGAGTQATATLAGDVSILTGCINRGSKDQQPSGLERSSSPAVGQLTFDTRSGRGTFSISTVPVDVDRDCPDTMRPVLISATFTNIVLTLTSNNKTAIAYFDDISVD